MSLEIQAGAVKLIVCDLDGTLLSSAKLISTANAEAIKAARTKGIFVSICTARIPSMTEAYSRALEINGPFIAANGAAVVNVSGGGLGEAGSTLLYKNCVDGKKARIILEYCVKNNFDHIAACASGCLYSPGSIRIKKFEQYNSIALKDDLAPIPLRPLGDYGVVEGEEIFKLLISGQDAEQQSTTEAFLASLGGVSFSNSESDLLDITALGVNKGSGLKNMARILGLKKEQVCAFGDFHNDIPMFEESGFSVAMGNGDEMVKNRASVVTGTNDEDGVAQAIYKYFI